MNKVIFILLPVFLLAGNYVLKKAEISPTRTKMISADYVLQGIIQSGAILRMTDDFRPGPQSTPDMLTPMAYSFDIYPNPFAKKTGVNYALPHPARVNIKVYDVSGKLVKTLVSERLSTGYYKADWHGDDDIGRKVPAGVYFIRMNTKEYKSQQKVIFVR